MFTDLNIDVEDTFESLHPGHRSLALCGALVTPAGIGDCRFVWPVATLSRRHLNRVLAVGRKDCVEAGEIDAQFRHQSCQPGNEIHGFKYDMRCAIAIRRLQFVAHLAIAGQSLRRLGGLRSDTGAQALLSHHTRMQ